MILCTIGYSLSTERHSNGGDDFKQRAAISSLFEIVVNLVHWNDWLDGLR
jgi:hypothetical protein